MALLKKPGTSMPAPPPGGTQINPQRPGIIPPGVPPQRPQIIAPGVPTPRAPALLPRPGNIGNMVPGKPGMPLPQPGRPGSNIRNGMQNVADAGKPDQALQAQQMRRPGAPSVGMPIQQPISTPGYGGDDKMGYMAEGGRVKKGAKAPTKTGAKTTSKFVPFTKGPAKKAPAKAVAKKPVAKRK